MYSGALNDVGFLYFAPSHHLERNRHSVQWWSTSTDIHNAGRRTSLDTFPKYKNHWRCHRLSWCDWRNPPLPKREWKKETNETTKCYRALRSNHLRFHCPANGRSLSNPDQISTTHWPVCAKSNAVYLEKTTCVFSHFDSFISHLVRIFSSVEKSKSN